ncbi:MAG TPA: VTT domain-containing protein [Gemmatimonadaceae bacterium]|nr:VTT domain-containing protein [Gemmatimonadaceae bacterium]
MTPILAFLQIATRHPQAAAALHTLWAYITLGATGIVTEEATPLIGGLMAHDHYLHLSTVMLSIALGTWLTDLGLYYVGRWQGRWARRRWPRLREWMVRTFRIVRRHPWRASMAVRWAYGLRLTLPIACGAARVPLPVYLIGSAISCITWAVFFTAIGWAFGETTLIVLGHVRRYENYLIALIVLLLIIGFWIVRARHVPDEVVEVLASGDTTEMRAPGGPEDAEAAGGSAERKER